MIINAEVYKTSKIVIATMKAMKKFILQNMNNNQPYFNFKCNDPKFMVQPYTRSLKRMNYKTEGKMKASGVLEAAQNNNRLHKADGHFYLEATTSRLSNNKFQTSWSVTSKYDFEPFDRHDYYSHIPLGTGILIVSDGLSEYLTNSKINVAKAFWYNAVWTEIWP